MKTVITFNYNKEEARPKLEDIELVSDLLHGSKIIEARNDGFGWHLLVERDLKLSECRGLEDDTWKYAYYKTSSAGDVYLASEYNHTPKTMRKTFDEEFWEDRVYARKGISA